MLWQMFLFLQIELEKWQMKAGGVILLDTWEKEG